MQILTGQRLQMRTNGLQARKQLLDPKIAKGVTAFQKESVQCHGVALRARGECDSNTADWGIERSIILTADDAHFCKLGQRMG